MRRKIRQDSLLTLLFVRGSVFLRRRTKIPRTRFLSPVYVGHFAFVSTPRRNNAGHRCALCASRRVAPPAGRQRVHRRRSPVTFRACAERHRRGAARRRARRRAADTGYQTRRPFGARGTRNGTEQRNDGIGTASRLFARVAARKRMQNGRHCRGGGISSGGFPIRLHRGNAESSEESIDSELFPDLSSLRVIYSFRLFARGCSRKDRAAVSREKTDLRVLFGERMNQSISNKLVTRLSRLPYLLSNTR